MNTLKKYLLLSIFSSVLLIIHSCEKPVLTDDITNSGETIDGNLTVSVYQLEQTPFSALTRTAASEACTRLNFAIYNEAGARIKQTDQTSDMANFGHASFLLPEGTYQVVVLAHSSNGNPTMTNPAKIPFTNAKGYTDTFLYGRLSELRERLNLGEGIMHKDEGHPSQMISRSKRMWNQVSGKTYAGIRLGMKHHMFNAGVVAIPQDKLHTVITTALAICDSMLAEEVEHVVIEQYSLSISLYEYTNLTEGDNCIGHYWGNKDEWERFAIEMLSKAYMQNMDADEETTLINESDFNKIPIHIHHSSTAARISKFVNRLFKDKNITYINQ